LETDIKNQPQPIVLDPFLKTPTDCKLIKNHLQGNGRQLWLIASKEANNEKKRQLENLNVKILVVESEQG
jgi:riboflavin biosynthesis pyrimidine reductase